jgi:hypothetical protein
MIHKFATKCCKLVYHMKIKNKYLRNKAFHNKHWNRIRAIEHPYKSSSPYSFWGYSKKYSYENQVKNHFEWITKQARAIESGRHKGRFHSTKEFRHSMDRKRKAQERNVLSKIYNGDYDIFFPKFKNDAESYYF